MATEATDLGGSYALPKPKFQIGDKAIWNKNDRLGNRQYFIGEYRDYLLSKWVGSRGTEILAEVLNIVKDATKVEIAGIVPRSAHVVDYAGSNQCYVGGVPGAASGVWYTYQLLIRKEVGGNTLAVITGMGIATDSELEKIVDK